MTVMSGDRLVSCLVALGSLVALALLLPEPAQACGGFFCSANAPVNQAAERIIFSKNEDGTVTAVVQIQYSGPSEDFAWVLPVPGIPDVDVSSDVAFRRLQQASNPQYITTQVVEGQCDSVPVMADGGSAGGAGGTGGGGGSGGRGVNVLAEGTVGPYDFVVIEPEASAQQIGDVAVDWLTAEGYDVVPPGGDPDTISELLGSYLEEEMNLLAFRLTKGNSTGTIRPIWITYDSERPMIPIRPTAVAANPDMGVMVWVLGEHRAVPINYKGLELNEALIDWRTAGSNYNRVVIAAADEAGGQGFVTERAGRSEDYRDVIVAPFERDDWEMFSSSVDELMSADVLVESARLFGSWDGYREVAEPALPDEVTIDEFLNCPQCVQDLLNEPFDKGAFVFSLEQDVVNPMLATQDLLLSRPYVTRLYTTMSAPEMDRDPLFDFNPDLPDASNIHNATQFIECGPGVSTFSAPSRFELEDGRIVRLAPGQPWPFDPTNTNSQPANSVVLELSTSGPGEVVTDNAAAITLAIAAHNATVPTTEDRVLNADGSVSRRSGGCTAAKGSPAPLSALGLALIMLLMRVRQRV